MTAGPVVDRVWRRLLHRDAPRPGFPLAEDPDLHLLVDGTRISPVNQFADTSVFELGQRLNAIRTRSRAAVPQELGVNRGARALGVAVRQMALARVAAARDPGIATDVKGRVSRFRA